MRVVLIFLMDGNNWVVVLVSMSVVFEDEEFVIIVYIWVFCSSVNVFILVSVREIYIRGLIELKDMFNGWIIVDKVLLLMFLVVFGFMEFSCSGKIEVCIVGKCRRGGL